MEDPSVLSRNANPDRVFVEVRPRLPVWIVNVLDAVRMSHTDAKGRAQSRDDLICEVLEAFANQRVSEANLIQRLSARNPLDAESNLGGD